MSQWCDLLVCNAVAIGTSYCTVTAKLTATRVNVAGQRAWLCFPLINWRDGGLLRIVRTFMELEVRRGGWFPRVSNFSPFAAGKPLLLGLDRAHHASPQPSPAVPQRPSTPEEINCSAPPQKQDDPFEQVGK